MTLVCYIIFIADDGYYVEKHIFKLFLTHHQQEACLESPQ